MSYLGDGTPPMTRREARALRQAQEQVEAAASGQTSALPTLTGPAGGGAPSEAYGGEPTVRVPESPFIRQAPTMPPAHSYESPFASAAPSAQETAEWKPSIPAPRTTPVAPSFEAPAPAAPPAFAPQGFAAPAPAQDSSPFASPSPFAPERREAPSYEPSSEFYRHREPQTQEEPEFRSAPTSFGSAPSYEPEPEVAAPAQAPSALSIPTRRSRRAAAPASEPTAAFAAPVAAAHAPTETFAPAAPVPAAPGSLAPAPVRPEGGDAFSDLDVPEPEFPASRRRAAAKAEEKARKAAEKQAAKARGKTKKGQPEATAAPVTAPSAFEAAPVTAQGATRAEPTKAVVVDKPPKGPVTLVKKAWLALALTLALVGAAATFAYPLYERQQGKETAAILSGSMEPTYMVRDQILINKVFDAQQLKVGDVITFAVRGTTTPTTHRIIAVTPPDPSVQGSTLTFATKGDNNPDADPDPVAPVNVIGVVEKDLGFWGKFMTFMNYGYPFSSGGDPDNASEHWWDGKWFARGLIFAPALLTMLLPEIHDIFIRDTKLSPAHRRRLRAAAAAKAEAAKATA